MKRTNLEANDLMIERAMVRILVLGAFSGDMIKIKFFCS